MAEFAIQAERLGKRYRIGEREPYQTLRDQVARLGQSIRRGTSAHEPERTFWALQDISFQLRRGEVLGVIGPNGAGKSTLLKILARITEPTTGSALIRGRVGSLLEVGTGFHPELTGRDNVYLAAAVLGMGRREIQGKFDAIVEFSGVERFIDTPVKHFSTGMQTRLAFAVAAHLEPEVLLVDEVLAVGDAAFQQKCLGKMGEVASSGRTVLCVSHHMATITSLCSTGLWLEEGRIRGFGAVNEVVAGYLSHAHARAGEGTVTKIQRKGGDTSRVRTVSFQARIAGQDSAPRTGAPAEFMVGYAAARTDQMLKLNVLITIKDERGASVFACKTSMTDRQNFRDIAATGRVVCRIEWLPLLAGTYSVDIRLKDEQGESERLINAASFMVIDVGESGMVLPASGVFGSMAVPQTWQWLPAEGQEVVSETAV